MSERPKHPALGEQGKPPRQPTQAEIKARQSPWYPKPYGVAEAAAIKGVADGTASADQQRYAMRYIINVLCATYDQSFRPGEEGRRDTDFAEGMRHVGNQIVKMINIDLKKITEDGEVREQG